MSVAENRSQRRFEPLGKNGLELHPTAVRFDLVDEPLLPQAGKQRREDCGDDHGGRQRGEHEPAA
ncbi:MAG: hypothetical protein WD066_04615 [Planctomycetaceae bacterium]